MPTRNPSLEVTNRTVLAIAVPMALGYLTTPLVGVADTAIVGQLGDAALIGGVAIAAIFVGVLLTTFNFLRFATSALTAQAFGRGDVMELAGILLRSCLVAVIVGALVAALSHPILKLGLLIMQPSAAVAEAASSYFLIRVLAAPITLLNFVLFSWLLGTGRTILSFLLQTFLNVLNVLISIYLVLVLDWGIAGAAWGTVIAEILTVALSVVFVVRPLLARRGQIAALTFNYQKLKQMMVLNSDIMVRSFCLFAAFAFFTRQSAQQSDTILAANEILLHFFMIGGYFLDGFATSAEQFVGRAIGSGNRSTFRRAIRITSLWNLGQATLLMLVYFIAGTMIIDFLTIAEDVRLVARDFLIWAAITPIVGVAAFQMDGVFIGATWSKDMRNSMLMSLAFLVASYFVLFPLMGNHGLWLALCLFLGARGLTLSLILLKRERETFQVA